MLEEWYTHTLELIPEGRRAWCLEKAISSSHDHKTAQQIVEDARCYEAFLKEVESAAAKPKKPDLKVAKSGD